MKPRVVVLRGVHGGGWLHTDGQFRFDRLHAAHLTPQQARELLEADRVNTQCRWSTSLWGTSTEYLPKRGRWQAMDPAEFVSFLGRWKIQRLLIEAARYESTAAAYDASARRDEQMATTMRERARAIRAELER